MKINWGSLTWVALRPLLINVLQSIIIRAFGPIGWMIKIVPTIVEKGIRPWFQMAMRKIKKKQRAEQGKKEAQETRDVPSDNTDDIYDSMQ